MLGEKEEVNIFLNYSKESLKSQSISKYLTSNYQSEDIT